LGNRGGGADTNKNGEIVATSPLKPTPRRRIKRPAGSKSSIIEMEMKETLASGARSIKALVAVGEKQLKIAERTYQADIFSDPTTPQDERQEFYAKKRAQILAEDAFES
jgi:hypothetical protein